MMVNAIEKLSNIKNIYISSEEFCKTTKQSCDCISLIADTGENFIAMDFCKAGDSWIEIIEVTEFDEKEYKYKLQDEFINLEKVKYDEYGIVLAIKFKCKDAFLFVFADEYNLILTKSKSDLFEDDSDILDEEATLKIVSRNNMVEKKISLSEDEIFILDVLRNITENKDDVIGPMLLLRENKENLSTNARKLRKYIEFKGRYVTYQDILNKSLQITVPIEQYYPLEMYAKYIGNTEEQLRSNQVYHVEMVFGDEEYYLIRLDNDAVFEFSAELFEIQEVSEFIYVGSENDDGTESVTDGFTVGERYKTLSLDKMYYTCENGLMCPFYEVNPIDFRKRKAKLPNRFENVDEALSLLRRAFEFGSIRELSKHLSDDCKYVSVSSGKTFHTRKEIVKHLQYVAKTQLSDCTFIDCALATITKSQESNKFSVGDRCIAIFEKDGCRDVVFVKLSEDNRYITGIYILNEYYEFQFDE